MLMITLGAVAGFIAWMIVWFSAEKIIAAISPESFGVHQRAFEEALRKGIPLSVNTTVLFTHVALVPFVSLLAGYLAALIAGEHARTPLILGGLLLAMGLAKAKMSWAYVPLWYHVGFTALMVGMAVVGGML